MGSSISAIYDDYDDYEFICKYFGLIPDIHKMYSHLKEILTEGGYIHKYEFFTHLRKSREREEKIDSIINI